MSGLLLPESSHQRQAASPRQLQIEDDEVRFQFHRGRPCGLGFECVADNLELRLVVQQQPQTFTHDLVGVDEEDSGSSHSL